MIYEIKDPILGMIPMPKVVNVSIEITDDEVILQIGPRDFAWDLKTGELNGDGTWLGGSVENDEDSEIVKNGLKNGPSKKASKKKTK